MSLRPYDVFEVCAVCKLYAGALHLGRESMREGQTGVDGSYASSVPATATALLVFAQTCRRAT